MRFRPLVPLLLLLSTLVACRKRPDPTAESKAVATASETKATETPRAKPVLDFIRRLDNCSVGHRGALVDLGDPTSRASFGTNLTKADVEEFEREGATWIRTDKRLLTFTFFSNDSSGAEGIAVGGRFRGGNAKSVTLLVNGRAVGDLPLVRGELAVAALKSTAAWITQGLNEVSVRFNGGGKAQGALGEIDWLRVGPYDDDSAYSPPTRADIFSSETIDGVVKRALRIRGPGYVRCDGFIPAHAEFQGSFAVKGGQADVEVRLLRDRVAPRILHTMHLDGTKISHWSPLTVEVTDSDALGSVEVSVQHATKGARVLMGEPAVYPLLRVAETKRVPARSAVVIVLGNVSAKATSPFGGKFAMPALDAFAKEAVRFDDHRAVTTLPHGEMGALLTGLWPRDTGMLDPFARLSRGAPFVAEALRQAGIVTGMFTANPLTSSSFGFERGWETFRQRLPDDTSPSTAIFEDASRWIHTHGKERFFAVVHARGGHPPWDVSEELLKKLPPEDYAGGVDPKHGGELLGRARHVPPLVRLTDADRTRAWALYAHALEQHDRALATFFAELHKEGRDEDTVVFVTSDTAPDESTHIPFGDAEPLDERSLYVPLIVRVPGEPPGTRTDAPTSAIDIAPTLFAALGLSAPAHFRGTSVFSPNPARPRLATAASRVSARWGTFILSVGAAGRETKMCDLALEPACVTDVRSTHPLTHSAFHRELLDTLLEGSPKKTEREPAALDAPTSQALKAWGID